MSGRLLYGIMKLYGVYGVKNHNTVTVKFSRSHCTIKNLAQLEGYSATVQLHCAITVSKSSETTSKISYSGRERWSSLIASAVTMSDPIFQKGLQDLIKGIRSHKKDPSAFISQAMASIKIELRSTDPFLKTEAVRNMTTFVRQQRST